jgi:glutaredoxin-related protein
MSSNSSQCSQALEGGFYGNDLLQKLIVSDGILPGFPVSDGRLKVDQNIDAKLLYKGPNVPVVVNMPAPVSKVFDADPDCFVTFYDPQCGYSRNAINLLQSRPDLKFKGYVIDNAGGLENVLSYFNQYSPQLQFDPNHTTKPIIFYQNKFLGGFDQLSEYLRQNQFGQQFNQQFGQQLPLPGFTVDAQFSQPYGFTQGQFQQPYGFPPGQIIGRKIGLDLDSE